MTDTKPTNKYPNVKRYDQRNDVFQRSDYDSQVIAWKEKFYSRKELKTDPGYTPEYRALTVASWYVEDMFAMGNVGTNKPGLYSWESKYPINEEKITEKDPAKLTQTVKCAAKFFGADLVGICELNSLWLYSHVVDVQTGVHSQLEIPEKFKYAIVMAIEMDQELIASSPTRASSAATGLGYSKMAFTAGLLAQFIRGLGYDAIPSGNDTALSIPIAVDAGLGELGRNGLLITEKYGPRVRLCKIFTDMPLLPDQPSSFGVQDFCEKCKKCAQHCPSRAIPFGEKSTEVPSISNNPGVNKWTINPEHCFRFWGVNQTDCSNCIRVCPFNQPPGLGHDLVRFLIKHFPFLNSFLIRMHSLFGYEKQADPAFVWKEKDK